MVETKNIEFPFFSFGGSIFWSVRSNSLSKLKLAVSKIKNESFQTRLTVTLLRTVPNYRSIIGTIRNNSVVLEDEQMIIGMIK